MNEKLISLEDIAEILEMNCDIRSILRLPYPAAVKKWKEFQRAAARQRKVLAKKYHPDAGGDQEKMQVINNLIDTILNTKLVPIRPRPIVVKVCYTTDTTSWTSAGSATTISYW